LGNHILLSLYGVPFSDLNNLQKILEIFEKSVSVLNCTVLNRFSHQFEPQGVTVVYALAESHISIHTFPESQSCALDIYTCGDMDCRKGMEIFIENLKPIEYDFKEVKR
jgi:S-adenosylmethionine decarboxylase